MSERRSEAADCTCPRTDGYRIKRRGYTVGDESCDCGADGGEGCWCCTDECPEDCMADHKREQ